MVNLEPFRPTFTEMSRDAEDPKNWVDILEAQKHILGSASNVPEFKPKFLEIDGHKFGVAYTIDVFPVSTGLPFRYLRHVSMLSDESPAVLEELIQQIAFDGLGWPRVPKSAFVVFGQLASPIMHLAVPWVGPQPN